jgi:cysteine desulfurase
MKESAVMAAMGIASEVAASFLRISFGPHTTEAEIDAFLAEWSRIASRSKAA